MKARLFFYVLAFCIFQISDTSFAQTNGWYKSKSSGNYQFQKVNIGANDLELAKPFLDPKITKQLAGMALKGIQIADSLKFPESERPNTLLIPIQDKHIFKLGGRDITVVSVSGHSPGSIFLLDSKNKFLFTGDNTQTTWLFFKESLSVETYLQNLQKLSTIKGQFNILFAGHRVSSGIELLEDLSECCKKILSGQSEAKPYHSFIGQDGVSCTYKTVTIAYNPDKIK
jgi:hypothetical protein